MTGRDIVGGLTNAAAAAAKIPVEAAEKAAAAAKDVARDMAAKGAGVADRLIGHGEPDDQVTVSEARAQEATEQALTGEETPGEQDVADEADGADEVDEVARAESDSADSGPPEPQVVLAEPAPPSEPPVDVVEQALAAEAAEAPVSVGGHATEPKASSRDEEHGDEPIGRAESEEIALEIDEGTEEA